jgi:hypothetical protein
MTKFDSRIPEANKKQFHSGFTQMLRKELDTAGAKAVTFTFDANNKARFSGPVDELEKAKAVIQNWQT